MKTYFYGVLSYFKNEGNSIHEWIMHNKKWGAEHIWLIDNGSSDEYNIDKYINDGYITLYKEPELGQIDSYQKYLPEIKKNVKWLGIFDMDEYPYSKKENDIKKILKNVNDDIKEVAVRLKNFYPMTFFAQKSTIEKNIYYSNASPAYPKCFYNLDLVDINQGAMIHGLERGISKNRRIMFGEDDMDLCVNHYQYGSIEYLYGIKQGRGGGVNRRKYGNPSAVPKNLEIFDTYLRDNSQDIIDNCKLISPKTEIYPHTSWNKLKNKYNSEFELFKTYGNEEKILSVDELTQIQKFMVELFHK